MSDERSIVPSPARPPANPSPTHAHHAGHQVVDFLEVPIRISPVPLPRSTNPAFRHLRAQAAHTSRVSKRSQLNRIARMIGAPEPPKLVVDDDVRKLHPQQLFPMDYVHWEDLTMELVSDLLFNLERVPTKRDSGKPKDLSPATRNTYRALLRGVAQEAWGLKKMPYEDVERIRSLKAQKYKSLPGGRAQSEDVIRALLEVCDSTDSALHCRDGVMIALLVTTGMRRAEIVGIQLSDIDEQTREVRITGKGSKERLIKIPDAVWSRLVDYLERYRGYEPGALLTPVWNNRSKPQVTQKGLSEATINQRLEAIRQKANTLRTLDIAPHDMRRTFATDLYNQGMSIRAIQHLLGHASAMTTETYLFDDSKEYRQQAAELNADRFGKPEDRGEQ